MTGKPVSVSRIYGALVKNSLGDGLGRIKDIMINLNNGEISYAILTLTISENTGKKYFAIPWKAFSHHKGKNTLTINLSDEKLTHAPGFNREDLPLHNANGYMSKVYKHYGFQKDW